MPYEVKFTKSARKIYLKFTPKLRTALDNCFAKLEEEPRHHPNIKKLKGVASDYRYQVGGWRIMYEIDDQNKLVTVYNIRPRGDAYKHGH